MTEVREIAAIAVVYMLFILILTTRFLGGAAAEC